MKQIDIYILEKLIISKDIKGIVPADTLKQFIKDNNLRLLHKSSAINGMQYYKFFANNNILNVYEFIKDSDGLDIHNLENHINKDFQLSDKKVIKLSRRKISVDIDLCYNKNELMGYINIDHNSVVVEFLQEDEKLLCHVLNYIINFVNEKY